MKKSIFLFVTVFVLISITGCSQKQTANKNVSPKDRATTQIVTSDYGFSYSIPAGWQIWEGYSATLELMNKTDFAEKLESGLSNLSEQKINEYQEFMDNWNYKSSEVIVFANSNKIDYQNRKLANAGKILSTQIDSQETLEQNSITMNISNNKVEKIEENNNDSSEKRNIRIGDRDSVLGLSKIYTLVDYYIIMLPVDSNVEAASSLNFTGYLQKGKNIDEIIKFIESLNISRDNNI